MQLNSFFCIIEYGDYMEIRELKFNDGYALSNLVVATYSQLDNLEWLPDMPWDELNLKALITNSRYKIIGAFENNTLLGCVALDLKCEKLINSINFPTNFDNSNLADVRFAMVHPNARGQGVMKNLLNRIIDIAINEEKTGIIVRSHIYNFITMHTFRRHGFETVAKYKMRVEKYEFENLKNQPFIQSGTKTLAEQSIEKFAHQDFLEFEYNILCKNLIEKEN